MEKSKHLDQKERGSSVRYAKEIYCTVYGTLLLERLAKRAPLALLNLSDLEVGLPIE